MLAGVGFGVSAIFIIKILFLVNKIAGHSQRSFRLLAFFGLIYLLVLSQALPEALGLGMGIINDLVSNVETTQMLLILLIAKPGSYFISNHRLFRWICA